MAEQDPEVTVELLSGSFSVDTSARLLYAAAVALLAAPLVALIWAWRRWAIATDRRHAATAVLIVVSLSYVLLLSAMVTDEMIGEHYSDRRYITIEVNLGLMVLVTLLSLRPRVTVRRPLIVSACLTAVAWFYLLVVSSVV